jgi:hypothetical protein
MGNTVRFKASLDDQVSGKLGKIRDNFDRLGKSKGARSILQGVGMGVGISAWGLLDRAISGVVNVMADAVGGAIEEERSIARLTTSLRANVAGWNGNTEAIEKTMAAQFRLGFSDEEQRDSLALLVAATHDATEALEVQRTAMDLARFKGISLAEATDALTKVEAGSYRILKSLGIALRTGATRTEALAAVQKVAAGQAEDYADTVEGRATAATIIFGEKLEALGSKALPMISDALSSAMDAMDAFDRAVVELDVDLTPLGQNLIDFVTAGPFAEFDRRAEKNAAAALKMRDALHYVGAALPPVVAGTEEMADHTEDYAKAAKDAAALTNDLRDALNDLSKSVYGPEELEGKIAEAEQALIDARKELRKFTEDNPDPTRKQRRSMEMLEGQVAEATRELFDLTIEAAAVNGLTYGEVRAAVRKFGIDVNSLGDQWARVVRLMGKAGSWTGPRPSGKGPQEFHSGGVVPGPLGSEQLAILKAGERVIPNGSEMSRVGTPGHSGGGGGGAPVTIAVQLDGRTIAEVVDRHLYYKAARAPRTAYAG